MPEQSRQSDTPDQTEPSSSTGVRIDRYHRQRILPGVGDAGQERLACAHAAVIGCGALGCVSADWLVRAGVGTITLIDRDVVDHTNLHRQTLYTQADADAGVPKAHAARARLAAVNPRVDIRSYASDLTPDNAEELLFEDSEPDILIDGTDNFETRFLLNDLSVRYGLPFVYGGAVGTGGMAAVFRPDGACLRCLFERPPPAGSQPTCDTAGVLGPVVGIVGSVQAAEAMKVLVGADDAVSGSLLEFDIWAGRRRRIDLSSVKRPGCPCCGLHRFEFLDSGVEPARSLCGKNAVQVSAPHRGGEVDLASLAGHLSAAGRFEANEWFVRGRLEESGLVLTVFADGRAIVDGTEDVNKARSLYARYVGA